MEEAKNKLELILKYFEDFTEEQVSQLSSLDHLYREWNSKINVISRKDIEGLYEKHVLHSLAIAAVFDFEQGMKVIDIGTGGGFPGIPLAILFPETEFHLVDSVGKKIKVVEAVAGALKLKNIKAYWKRAEEMHRNHYDTAVSRAVAPLKELWAWTLPLLKKNASFTSESVDKLVPYGLVCLKGGDLAKEISDSGLKPRIMEIYSMFPETYFEEKYILYQPARKG